MRTTAKVGMVRTKNAARQPQNWAMTPATIDATRTPA
jgi:hypothetical protein